MKKIYRMFALAALAALAAAAAGCKNDNLDTDQYSNTGVRLVSYGPNPVMRGGALTFIGSNLDRIVSVEVPGVDPISEIEVVSKGLRSEIRVVLPVEGPEPGNVVLISGDGKKFTTRTELEYTEPIVLESFTTVRTPAYPGDELVLKGDYMDLVRSVIFEGGEAVNVENIDRHEARAVIPSSAYTGKIILSDEGEIANLIYSEKELQIGDPTVSGIKAAGAWKKGVEVTITGEHLDMVEFVDFGDIRIDTEDLAYSENRKSLITELPAEVGSCSVNAVSYAGKTFKAGDIVTVVPTDVKAPADAVKAGTEIEITGKDLDLVTSVSFPGADAGTFEVNGDGTVLTVTVPMKAAAGDITLTLDNGDSVTAAYTLVKATLTGINVPEGTVTAGQSFSVTGTDLDLIASAALGGKAVEIAVSDDGGGATVTTDSGSVTGKLVLTQYNGETIESEAEVTIVYDSYIVVTSMPAEAHIGELVTLTGSNFLMIENIHIGDAKVISYGKRSDSELSFVMPFNKVGTYPVHFDLLNGSRETCPQSIGVLLEQTFTTIWAGSFAAGNWGGNQDLAWGGYDWSSVKAGQTLRFTLEQDASQPWWQLALRHGDSWGELTEKVFVEMTEGQTVVDVVLTQTNLEDLAANGGLVITGCNYTLSKIELIGEVSQEVTVWSGSEYTGADYNNNLTLGGEDDWVNAGLKVGDTIRIYFTAESDTDWQIQLFDGHWGGMNMLFPDQDAKNQFNAANSPTAISDGYISFKVTDEILAVLTSHQGWGNAIICQGKGITFTEITFI